MQARVPQNRVIGQRYSHRDYFNAYGRDILGDEPELDGRTVAELRPHQFLLSKLGDHQAMHSAHLSDVFLSTATKHLQVTFSVPIWDRPAEQLDKHAIGIFAISLEIQDLPLPDNAMMVQIRPDQLTGEAGLVISHRQLQPHTDQDLPPHVSSVVDLATQLKQHRFRERRQGFRSANLPVDPLVSNFSDPVLNDNSDKVMGGLAAIEPVIVHTRPEIIADTGWAVVVNEPASPTDGGDP